MTMPRGDHGPAIRLRAVRSHTGVVLREADAVVSLEPDSSNPRITVRRARSSDPLVALLRIGTVTARQFDAVELLRTAMEQTVRMAGVSGSCEGRTAPHQRGSLTQFQMAGCEAVREASAAVGPRCWPVVVWLAGGGTIRGYAAHVRRRHVTSASLLIDGLDRLADYYRLSASEAA
jgi:hypothetical protein